VLTFVKIPIGTGGGVRCTRCFKERTAEEFFDAARILGRVSEVVSAWQAGPGPNIAYTGAEPFRHPDLVGLVRGAVAAGVQRMCLATDATALPRGENAEGAVSAGVRHLEVTLLGGSAHTHDDLSGRPGSFDSAMEGIRAVRAAADALGVPFLICGRVHVGSHNVKDLPAMMVAFTQVGASSVTLEFSGSVPKAVVRPWVGAAIETGIVNGVWVSLEGMSAAELGVNPLHDVRTMNIAEDAAGAVS